MAVVFFISFVMMFIYYHYNILFSYFKPIKSEKKCFDTSSNDSGCPALWCIWPKHSAEISVLRKGEKFERMLVILSLHKVSEHESI